MKLLRLLTLSQLSVYRSRMLLAFFSMVACVCLVVWLVGSFESLRGEFDNRAETYMGSYDLYVSPAGPGGRFEPFNPAVVEKISGMPGVAQADAVEQSRLVHAIAAKLYRPGDQPMRERMGIPSQSPILTGSDIIHSPYELSAGVWPDMSATTNFVGVLGTGSARMMGIELNDDLIVFTEAGRYSLKIVGFVEQSESTPDISSQLSAGAGPAFAALFVPAAVAEKITGRPLAPNLLGVRLDGTENKSDFKIRLVESLKNDQVALADIDTLRFRLDDNRRVRAGKTQAWSAAGMVLLCCIFIIFTTLNMGVNERIRQLALLRSIGLTRSQVAGQIVCESFLLSIPAWLGGLLLGYGLLTALHTLMPAEYPATPQITGPTFLFSGVCAIGGGLLASVIPAWRATRVAPLDAIQESVKQFTTASRLPVPSTIIGIILLCISPLILTVPGLEPEFRKNLYSTAGYLSLFIGIICLAPALIHLTESLLSSPLSRLLGLNPRFLSFQLTRQMSRTVGTVVSLSIGLGLFVAIQCWGYSMVVPFKPTRSVPDVLVSFLPTGISDSQWEQVSHAPGVISDEFLPIALEQTRIEDSQKNSKGFSLISQNNVLIAGVDINKAFEGKKPLLNFKFVSGDKDKAIAQLKTGRHILIPEGLSIATRLNAGDILKVVPPRNPEDVIEYTIAGVIDFPGWHWITKTTGMRRQEGGFTAGLLLTDFDTARRDYELEKLQFFWMNVVPGTDLRSGNLGPRPQRAEGLPQSGRQGGSPPSRPPGMGGGRASYSGALELAMQSIAEENTGQEIDIARLQGVRAEHPYAKVSSSEGISTRIQNMADRAITQTSKLPLIGLALTSLALINTLMASVRVRSREFGLLRSLGLTRSDLFRLVLGESLLIGFAAIILSFCFGLVAAWGSINLGRFGYVFGGIVPSLVIPWKHLAVGFGMTLGLCLLAALWPAMKLVRKQPLTLLRSDERSSRED